MTDTLIEDSKVIGSASVAVLLDYAQVFNQLITLLISICTLVYVANRAYHTLHINQKKNKKKGRRK